jgi:hypothetical protein
MTAPAFAGTGAVRDAHRFDEERLAQWMAANLAFVNGRAQIFDERRVTRLRW